jgi:hypothetical protein
VRVNARRPGLAICVTADRGRRTARQQRTAARSGSGVA